MWTIGRNRRSARLPRTADALGPRAIRVRNVFLQRIAIRRGVRAPAQSELASLDECAGLRLALERWEALQNAEKGAPAPTVRGYAWWKWFALTDASVSVEVAIALGLYVLLVWIITIQMGN